MSHRLVDSTGRGSGKWVWIAEDGSQDSQVPQAGVQPERSTLPPPNPLPPPVMPPPHRLPRPGQQAFVPFPRPALHHPSQMNYGQSFGQQLHPGPRPNPQSAWLPRQQNPMPDATQVPHITPPTPPPPPFPNSVEQAKATFYILQVHCSDRPLKAQYNQKYFQISCWPLTKSVAVYDDSLGLQ